MLASKTISLWILTFWITFVSLSANPTELRQRQRPDPIQELPPTEITQGSTPESPDAPAVDDVTQVFDDDDDVDDEEFYDDDDLEDDEFDVDAFEEDVAMEEEDMFSKLEGSTIPKRVVKMLKLISDDDQFMDGKGNTVRSYMPSKKEVCLGLGDAYVFTMRSMNDLDDPEDLKYAELHFYAKNFLEEVHGDEYDEIPISFYHVAAAGCIPIGLQNLKIPQNGWLVTNVTSILSHVLLDDPSKVTIAMYIGQGAAALHSLTHHDTSQEKLVKPYAFVYTDDTGTQGGGAQANWEWLAENLAKQDSDSLAPNTPLRSRREAVFNNSNESIKSNEYPLHPVGETHPATTHTAFKFFAEQNLKRIKSSRRRARNQRKKAKNKDMMMLEAEEEEEKSRSRKKKLNKPRPKHLDIEVSSDDRAANPCARYAMRVNFETIRWSDFIIAPAHYDSYYCAGKCSFPIAEELRPTNHAVIQSIVKALQVQKVPSPCCVPEKMEPLSILYQNDDSEVVLKKFNDMIVKSCHCL